MPKQPVKMRTVKGWSVVNASGIIRRFYGHGEFLFEESEAKERCFVANFRGRGKYRIARVEIKEIV